jgi:hypothetical protein
MVDVKIHTDALKHTECGGWIVFVTVGRYKHSICDHCGKITKTEKAE